MNHPEIVRPVPPITSIYIYIYALNLLKIISQPEKYIDFLISLALHEVIEKDPREMP